MRVVILAGAGLLALAASGCQPLPSGALVQPGPAFYPPPPPPPPPAYYPPPRRYYGPPPGAYAPPPPPEDPYY